MTVIERLWDKAKTDDKHKLVNDSLLEQSSFTCQCCGAEAELDIDKGSIICKNEDCEAVGYTDA